MRYLNFLAKIEFYRVADFYKIKTPASEINRQIRSNISFTSYLRSWWDHGSVEGGLKGQMVQKWSK